MKHNVDKTIVCIVGLGYVGLPLAEAFARSLRVIGFDNNSDKVAKLRKNNNNKNLSLTASPAQIAKADFVTICVPTPVTKSKEPDLSSITSAARIVARNMKKGSIVILESTVYPGITEEVVQPILEESGLKSGVDFKIAYCPERINPGDSEHAIDKTTKVVAGMDAETIELVAQLCRKVTPNVFKA